MTDPKQPKDELPELVDIEQFAKEGRDVPDARGFQLRIDKERYTVHKSKLTGREILALAGKTPEAYILHQRERRGVTKTVEADEVVSLLGPGPERFMTLKREAQEGFVAARQFRLSSIDEAFLDESFPGWEAVIDGGLQWIILRNFPVGRGYTVERADLAIQVIAGYPTAPLDMAYFLPALQRTDGKEIPAMSPQPLQGATWQRWSRHRTGANPWIVDQDNISTHIAYIRSFLAEEFTKRP